MEIWKDIKGFEGNYQISNYGQVKRVKNGDEYIRKLSLTKDGYQRVRLLCQGKDKTTRVHRLVAEAFIDNPNKKPTVNHKDGNKLNNHADNLEWATHHEQLQHAYDLGLKKPVHTNRKLTNDDVRYIRTHYKKQSMEFSTVALSKKFGVSNRVIGLIVRGMAYKNVN